MLAIAADTPSAQVSRPRIVLDPPRGPHPETGWPLLALPVPTGFPSPSPTDTDVERYLSLDDHLIRNPEDTVLLRVHGDGPAESGIHDGDLLVVDRVVPPSTGSWVVVVVDEQFALRYLDRDAKGQRVLQAAHPDIPDRLLQEVSDSTIWGVVRWTIHRMWPGRGGLS